MEYFPRLENYATDRGFISAELHSRQFPGSPSWYLIETFNTSICRWPPVSLTVTPESIVTYPEHSVDVILEFPTVQCAANENTSPDIDLPEFWLELFYCGHDVFCTAASAAAGGVDVQQQQQGNASTPTTLYAELVRGFPRHRLVQLRCELFGLAGNYAVKLRAAKPGSTFLTQTAFIKVPQFFFCSPAVLPFRE